MSPNAVVNLIERHLGHDAKVCEQYVDGGGPSGLCATCYHKYADHLLAAARTIIERLQDVIRSDSR